MADSRRAVSAGAARVQGAPARRVAEQPRNVSTPRDTAPAPSSAPRRMQASPARSSRRRDRASSISSELSQQLATQPTPTIQLRLARLRRSPEYSQGSANEVRSDSFLLPPQMTPLPSDPNRTFWEYDDSPSQAPSSEHGQIRMRFAAFRQKLIISLWPARIMLMALGCLAVAIIYGLKFNLSSSIDVMVNRTAMMVEAKEMDRKGLLSCPSYHELYKDGPFLWDEVTQRMLVNGYLYGYMGSQIPGAILAERFGGKWVVFAAVVANGLCCVLTPTTAKHAEWDMLLLLLMTQGAAGGLLMPSITTLISHWAPPTYRSTFCGVMYGGLALGNVVTLLMRHVTLEHGWEYRFHFLVLITLPFAVLWGLWVHSSPVGSFFIIPRVMVGGDRADGVTIVPIRDPGILQFPLLEIKNSMAFWALVVARFGGGCGFYIVMTQIPQFVKQVQEITLQHNVGYYILPYILMFIVSAVSGIVMDYLHRRKGFSIDSLRKIGAAVAMLVPAGCIVGMSWTYCTSPIGPILFMVAVPAVGAESVSYLANHIDISPNFASVLMAITNIVSTLPHIIIPIILSYSPMERESPDTSFYVIAAIYVTTFVFFAMFASGNVQSWNHVSK